MTFLRSKRNLLLAAVCIAALQGLSVRHASAQQIGYFTFDTPATAISGRLFLQHHLERIAAAQPLRFRSVGPALLLQ